MIITNRYNLPPQLLNAAKQNNYRGRNMSPSAMWKSPRQLYLYRRYFDVIQTDVIENLWALFGSAMHTILEKGKCPGDSVECHFQVEGKTATISGIMDVLSYAGNDEFDIHDWKVTKIFSHIKGDQNYDYQLNTYKYLAEHNGFKIRSMFVHALFKDFSRWKMMSDNRYPELEMLTYPIKPMENMGKIISERIEYHLGFENTPDDELPECSDVEKWQDPPQYAVMKKGGVRSKKNCDSKAEAEAWIEKKVDSKELKNHYIEERPSKPVCCLEFCSAWGVCNHYLKWVEQNPEIWNQNKGRFQTEQDFEYYKGIKK